MRNTFTFDSRNDVLQRQNPFLHLYAPRMRALRDSIGVAELSVPFSFEQSRTLVI